MTNIPLVASAIVAAAFGAVLMSAGAVAAATPAPAPSLTQSQPAAFQVRMMRRSMVKRGRGRTISRKLGARTR